MGSIRARTVTFLPLGLAHPGNHPIGNRDFSRDSVEEMGTPPMCGRLPLLLRPRDIFVLYTDVFTTAATEKNSEL